MYDAGMTNNPADKIRRDEAYRIEIDPVDGLPTYGPGGRSHGYRPWAFVDFETVRTGDDGKPDFRDAGWIVSDGFTVVASGVDSVTAVALVDDIRNHRA